MNKKFLFVINNQIYKPIEKEEGLYVFLEPMEAVSKVEIVSTDFHNCTAVVRKDELNKAEPIADVRLFGKPGKSFSNQSCFVYGKIEDSTLTFPVAVGIRKSVATGLVLKEIKKIDQSTFIQVTGFSKDNLIGKTFALVSGKKLDTFFISEKSGINEYRVEGNVINKHDKGTLIERIYRSVTDEKGNYAIPVEQGEEQLISEVIMLQHR